MDLALTRIRPRVEAAHREEVERLRRALNRMLDIYPRRPHSDILLDAHAEQAVLREALAALKASEP